MNKKLIAPILLIALFSAVLITGCKKQGADSIKGRIDLTYYKLFDDEDTMQSIISDYKKIHPNVSIKYRKFIDPAEYEDLILNEFAEGEGPDIFEVSNSGFPRFFKKIFPLESPELTPQILEENFVSVVAADFVKEDPADGKQKIYGIPLSVDTPVVYYNKEVFERKIPEIGKPKGTWDDLVNAAFKLREENEAKELIKGGIAMGRADNISGAFDVLMNLMLQEGVGFYDDKLRSAKFANNVGEDALDLFISFSDPKMKQYSWNEKMTVTESELKEVEAFLTGRVAMMIGYSDVYRKFEVDLKNLKAQGFPIISLRDIGLAPLPQKSDVLEEKKVFAKYYGQTVSKNSKKPDVAWDFIDFMTQKKSAKKYASKSGKPASRRDLIADQKKDPVLGIFVSQVGFAENIPMYNELRYRELFNEAIQKAAVKTTKPAAALSEVQEAVNAILPETGLFPRYVKPAGRRVKK